MNGLIYQITMQTGLALSVDGNNPHPGAQLILNDSEPSNPLQVWTAFFYPPTQASVLFNPGTGLYAAPASIDKGAAVVLFSMPSGPAFDGSHTWELVRTAPYAVRPPANGDLNLNAFGNSWSPGTKVGLWTWSGGDKNELWSFKPSLGTSLEMKIAA